jgi:hypothetical protein
MQVDCTRWITGVDYGGALEFGADRLPDGRIAAVAPDKTTTGDRLMAAALNVSGVGNDL